MAELSTDATPSLSEAMFYCISPDGIHRLDIFDPSQMFEPWALYTLLGLGFIFMSDLDDDDDIFIVEAYPDSYEGQFPWHPIQQPFSPPSWAREAWLLSYRQHCYTRRVECQPARPSSPEPRMILDNSHSKSFTRKRANVSLSHSMDILSCAEKHPSLYLRVSEEEGQSRPSKQCLSLNHRRLHLQGGRIVVLARSLQRCCVFMHGRALAEPGLRIASSSGKDKSGHLVVRLSRTNCNEIRVQAEDGLLWLAQSTLRLARNLAVISMQQRSLSICCWK